MNILQIDNIPKDGSDDVAVESVTVRYIQQTDCAEEKGFQTLTLSTVNNGTASFIRMNIGDDSDSENWSMNPENAKESLVKIIDDFIRRAGLESEDQEPKTENIK